MRNRHRPRLAPLATLLLALLAAARAGAEEDLAAALAAAVEAPDPAARAPALAALAGRPGVTADALLAAARALPAAGPPPPGEHDVVLPAFDGTKVVGLPCFLVVPPGHDPGRPAPLIFAHHGAGGRPGDAVPAWRSVAASLGAILFCPGGTTEGGYAFGREERTALLSALREIRRLCLVDDDRIFITGFSRGGHVTWDLALRHPGVFAAAAPLVGGPRLSNARGENNLRFLEHAVTLPLRDLQGARDDPLLVENLRLAFRRLDAWKAADARLIEFPDRGHDCDPSAVDWVEWLSSVRREPRPRRVLRRAARAGEGRHLWLDVLEPGTGVAEVFTPRVDRAKWARMAPAEQREWMADEIERRTARAEARREGPGRFSVASNGVKRLRLLLEPADLPPDGAVSVVWNGRPCRRTVKPDALLLLREFAATLDRSFLPVAEFPLP